MWFEGYICGVGMHLQKIFCVKIEYKPESSFGHKDVPNSLFKFVYSIITFIHIMVIIIVKFLD